MTIYLNGKKIPERLDDDVQHVYGSSNDVRFFWNTSQTVDALYLGLPDAQNVLVLGEVGDRSFDFAHGVQTNPTLFVHSANQNTTQWLSLTHNATNAVITSGLGGVQITHSIGITGVPTTLTVTGAAHTGLTAATLDVDANFNLARNKTWAAGAGPLATQYDVGFQAATYLGDVAGALTITDAATVYINAAPTAGANMTITNPWALWIDANNARIDGLIEFGAIPASGTASTRYQIYRAAGGTVYQVPGSVTHTFGVSTANPLVIAATGSVFTSTNSADADVTGVTSVANSTGATGGDNDLTSFYATSTYNLIAGTLNRRIGFLLSNMTVLNGTVTNQYGIYLNALTGATNNYGALIACGASETAIYIDAGTTDHTGANLITIDLDVNSASVNAFYADIDVGTALSVGEIVNGISIDIDGNAGDNAASGMNGIYLTSANTTAGINTGLNIAGTWDTAIMVVGSAPIILNSSPKIYSSVVNTVYISDSTGVNGLTFALAAAGSQNIKTISTAGGITFQNQTFTVGANHNATSITPTWAAENFTHTALSITAIQNGDNSTSLTGINVGITKATDATTLVNSYGVYIQDATVAGTLNNIYGLYIENIDSGSTTNNAIYAAGGSSTFKLNAANTFTIDASTTTHTGTRGFYITYGAANIAARAIDVDLNVANVLGAGVLVQGVYSDVNGLAGDNATSEIDAFYATSANTTGGVSVAYRVAGTFDYSFYSSNFRISSSNMALGGVDIDTAKRIKVGGDATVSAEMRTISVDAITHTTAADISDQRYNAFIAPTISSAGLQTITKAATVYVSNAPQAGGAAVITDSYALWVDAGYARFDGGLLIGATDDSGTDWIDVNRAAFSSGSDYNTTSINVGNFTHTITGGPTTITASFNAAFYAQTINGAGNTCTTAATVYISAAPSGTATLTNPLALLIDAGKSRFDGQTAINMGTAPSDSVVLSVGWNASTMAAGTTAARHFQTQGNITELINAAITDIVGAYFNTFTITDGGGTETVGFASTVYIANAPTVGTTPTIGTYALFVDDGIVRMDGNISLGGDIGFSAISGTTTISTVSTAGVARAVHFDIPVAAGGAADAALDFQFKIDGTMEAGLLAETDGAGTYRQPVWKIPYMTGDYGAAWLTFTPPAPASLANGGMVVAYNSNAGVLASRLYIYSNGAWVSTALA